MVSEQTWAFVSVQTWAFVSVQTWAFVSVQTWAFVSEQLWENEQNEGGPVKIIVEVVAETFFNRIETFETIVAFNLLPLFVPYLFEITQVEPPSLKCVAILHWYAGNNC